MFFGFLLNQVSNFVPSGVLYQSAYQYVFHSVTQSACAYRSDNESMHQSVYQSAQQAVCHSARHCEYQSV